MKKLQKIFLIISVFVCSVTLLYAENIKRKESSMGKDLMGVINVMAYGYSVKVFINSVDIGIRGGKSESFRLFGKEHSMAPRLPEDMKHLACLKPGENEIKIEYQRMKDVDSTGLTVELKSEEQFTSDENLINFREDPDKNGEPKSITKKFNL
ncbi:MAG: hypothetical protein JRG75_10320 [Deltaproteobacteria bacterium]|nr:hypothetical protein [Deltaproteobacteria bacterium]